MVPPTGVNTGAVSYRLCDRLRESQYACRRSNDMLLSGDSKIAVYV